MAFLQKNHPLKMWYNKCVERKMIFSQRCSYIVLPILSSDFPQKIKEF